MRKFFSGEFRMFATRTLFVAAVAIGAAGCESASSITSNDSDDPATEATRAARRGDVLVIGGSSMVSVTTSALKFKGENRAELFNPRTKTFAATDALTSARGGIQAIGFTSGARAHQVLVPGGAGGNGELNKTNGKMTVNANALRTSEMYQNSQFHAGAAMIGNRAFYTATVLKNGTVLVTGGFQGKTPLRTAEIYNPTTNKFTKTAGLMTAARAMHTATLLKGGANDGKVLIVGGITNGQGDTSNTAELYDPVTRRFTKIADMMAQGVAGHTATLITGCCNPGNGWVAIIGGFSGDGTASNPATETTVSDIVIFDPGTQLFQTAAQMTETRAFHTATLFDGKVHITGGVRGVSQFGNNNFVQFAGGKLQQSVEVYDLQLGDTTCVGGTVGFGCKLVMKSPRGAHTATLFKSGPLQNKILLAGGNEDRTTEIYDPAAGTFVSAGKMRVGHGFHAAVIVP
jgi:hypothetical protein